MIGMFDSRRTYMTPSIVYTVPLVQLQITVTSLPNPRILCPLRISLIYVRTYFSWALGIHTQCDYSSILIGSVRRYLHCYVLNRADAVEKYTYLDIAV